MSLSCLQSVWDIMIHGMAFHFVISTTWRLMPTSGPSIPLTGNKMWVNSDQFPDVRVKKHALVLQQFYFYAIQSNQRKYHGRPLDITGGARLSIFINSIRYHSQQALGSDVDFYKLDYPLRSASAPTSSTLSMLSGLPATVAGPSNAYDTAFGATPEYFDDAGPSNYLPLAPHPETQPPT